MRCAPVLRLALVGLFLILGCSDPTPPGMPSEPPKELPEDYRNKMKNMNPPPKDIPRGGVRPTPAKPAPEK